MKLLLVGFLVSICTVSAQWENLEAHRGQTIGHVQRIGDSVVYASGNRGLYRRGADSIWRMIPELFECNVRSITASGDTLVVLASQLLTSNYYQTNLYWHVENALAWNKQEFPYTDPNEFNLIPGSCEATRSARFGYHVSLQVINGVSGAIRTKRIQLGTYYGSISSYPYLTEYLFVIRPEGYETGPLDAIIVSNLILDTAMWAEERFPIPEIPDLLGNFGYRYEVNDTLFCVGRDTVIKVTLPDSVFSELKPSSFYVFDSVLYCFRYGSNVIWRMLDSTWQMMLLPLDTEVASIIEVRSDTLTLGSKPQGLVEVVFPSGEVRVSNIGLNRGGTTRFVKSGDVLYSFDEIVARPSVAFWDDSKNPLDVQRTYSWPNYKSQPSIHFDRFWYIHDSLASSTFVFDDFRNEGMATDYRSRITSGKSRLFLMRGDSVFSRHIDSMEWSAVPMNREIDDTLLTIAVYRDTLLVFSASSNSKDEAEINVEGYDDFGNLVIQRRSVVAIQWSYARRMEFFEMTNGLCGLISPLSHVAWTTSPSSSWELLNVSVSNGYNPTIFDDKVWKYKWRTQELWSSSDFVGWKYYVLPKLPLSDMNSAVCTSNNCYAGNSYGLYYLPFLFVNVGEEEAESPTSNNPTIVSTEIESWLAGNLTIHDVSGKTIRVQNVEKGEQVDLTGLVNGVYFVTITNEFEAISRVIMYLR